ncbi:MAG: penicillin-binding protein 2 [candidate division KSB1 bacterium]|jgi:penicillin-binding protein 2|nr:penicillin-binding protein 2 [candidate division KSB1 bacterium]
MLLNIRKKILYVIVSLIFFGLVLRFSHLQIYEQSRYTQESEKNRIRDVVIQPSRGLILDRNGRVIVDNVPSYSVFCVPVEMDYSWTLLSKILGLSESQLQEKIDKNSYGQFARVKLKRQISFEELSKIEEQRLDLPGISYDIEPRRYYPSEVKAPHIFGYLGEADNMLLKSMDRSIYHPGDLVGKTGLEKVYDLQLRGIPGHRFVEVDALGREVNRGQGDLERIAAVPGQNLHLTLDGRLQLFLEEQFSGISGGAVVVDCSNGEILAMVSKPDYDLSLFTKPLTHDLWKTLSEDTTKPLFDRMVQSLYPPGSTFKLAVAAAALEQGKGYDDMTFTCDGAYRYGNRMFDCWKEEGHGTLDLMGAIEQSCNVYFYQLGLKLGIDILSEYARKFRFGLPTQIDLMEESAGFVPDRDYLNKTYGFGNWTQGLVLNLAVGQGDLLVTPLQMAALAMIIANKGIYFNFHLMRYLEEPVSRVQSWGQVEPTRIDGISESTFDKLRQGMFKVVNGENGTGRACRLPNIQIAGKTGTAQNPHGDDHAWFIGFAPYESPEIAFSVFIENGGGGGAVAAPLARLLIEEYYHLEISRRQ